MNREEWLSLQETDAVSHFQKLSVRALSRHTYHCTKMDFMCDVQSCA